MSERLLDGCCGLVETIFQTLYKPSSLHATHHPHAMQTDLRLLCTHLHTACSSWHLRCHLGCPCEVWRRPTCPPPRSSSQVRYFPQVSAQGSVLRDIFFGRAGSAFSSFDIFLHLTMKLGSQHSLMVMVGFRKHSFPRNSEDRCRKLTNSEEKNQLYGNPGGITEKSDF